VVGNGRWRGTLVAVSGGCREAMERGRAMLALSGGQVEEVNKCSHVEVG
jgi:hypothetical protein